MNMLATTIGLVSLGLLLLGIMVAIAADERKNADAARLAERKAKIIKTIKSQTSFCQREDEGAKIANSIQNATTHSEVMEVLFATFAELKKQAAAISPCINYVDVSRFPGGSAEEYADAIGTIIRAIDYELKNPGYYAKLKKEMDTPKPWLGVPLVTIYDHSPRTSRSTPPRQQSVHTHHWHTNTNVRQTVTREYVDDCACDVDLDGNDSCRD